MRSGLKTLVAWAILGLAFPSGLRACPNCRDATAATPGATSVEQSQEACAFNRSIYLMAGMPFLLVGGFGIVLTRRLKP
ncbi:MAG: hypothetical protein EXR99_16175 [Gemmataceae bacterium]|nr:hypothetical protein [Gemmataceae bacterium]